MNKVIYVLPYNPGRLIDSLLKKLNLTNDFALSLEIGISASVISKIRSRKLQMSAGFLVRASELTGERTRTLRALMGDRRKLHRISSIYMLNAQTQYERRHQ